MSWKDICFLKLKNNKIKLWIKRTKIPKSVIHVTNEVNSADFLVPKQPQP